MKTKKREKNKKHQKSNQQQEIKQQQKKDIVCDNPQQVVIETAQPEQHQQNPPQNQNQHRNFINKQQSLDFYMELKLEEHRKQSQPQQLIANSQQIQKMMRENNRDGLICLQDSDSIMPIRLQASPRSHKPIGIQIISYRTTTFMGMSTQIFTLKINDPNSEIFYQIQRRFSNFADLYEQLFYNHPGYVLPPFPDKTLQSFIKIKMGLIIELGQKSEIVQKRMKQLQYFLRKISEHKELCNSQQFSIFISANQAQFEEGTIRLNKYAEQFKSLQSGSQLKNLLNVSKSLFSSYFSGNNDMSNQNNQIFNSVTQYNNHKISQFEEQIRTLKQKLTIILQQTKLLKSAEQFFSQFNGMETENDGLQKLCAKLVSSRNFSGVFHDFLATKVIDQLKLLLGLLEQSQKNLIHLAEIIDNIVQLKKNSDEQKKAKLQRRLQRTQRNFEYDWPSLYEQLTQRSNFITQSIRIKWNQYKSQMKRVWRFPK